MSGAWLTWSWLAQNILTDFLFWAVPTGAAVLLSKTTLKRLIGIWKEHVHAQKQIADALDTTTPGGLAEVVQLLQKEKE